MPGIAAATSSAAAMAVSPSKDFVEAVVTNNRRMTGRITKVEHDELTLARVKWPGQKEVLRRKVRSPPKRFSCNRPLRYFKRHDRRGRRIGPCLARLVDEVDQRKDGHGCGELDRCDQPRNHAPWSKGGLHESRRLSLVTH
jgi:hypothetical protein